MKYLFVFFALIVASLASSQQMERPKELDKLDFFAGRWVTEKGTPENSTNKFTATWELGKRHLVIRQTGKVQGMEMEGMMVMSWDEAKKKYIATWFDSMGGMAISGWGGWNGDSFVTVSDRLKIEGMDGMIRTTFTKTGDDKMTMDVSLGEGEKWQSFLNITFDRQK